MRFLAAILALLVLVAPCPVRSAPSTPAASSMAKPEVKHATFAGGCFWCMETAYEGRPGVVAVISGFAGGKEANPTYDEVSAGRTGHMESVEVVYHPSEISYERLLEIYWHNIDPTQGDGQFCDRGAQYRSAIFVRDDNERKQAERSKSAIEKAKTLHAPIVTRILPFTGFWPAEEYHQDYFRKNPDDYHRYREGCGRDRRLRDLWGAKAGEDPAVH
ncbi:MAG TPA: peptide-methionine (S)-S-oxide reductase MsrA [Candidatus Eisenbacteria bacterium]|nr:peptide-methionine (S)-S-oxide reductase MsrA [Candidatus Eisenbacteria bacterium]